MSEQRILIIEDEPDLLRGLALNLKAEGYGVLTASRGDAGVEQALRDRPDLVLLDIMLPGMYGLDVCRELRRKGFEAPIIMLTAKAEEVDRVVGLEIGADDYVTKPFSPRELVARIRVILRRMSPPAPRTTAASAPAPPFELRALEARILFRAQPLELTRYEYLLLKTLLEHPAHVLSRGQLMDRVWTDAPDTLERTVDAHIKSLRAKLRQVDASADPIQTHRGMGYSLVL
jgi:two-component system catabolic regulation response regulator CreB